MTEVFIAQTDMWTCNENMQNYIRAYLLRPKKYNEDTHATSSEDAHYQKETHISPRRKRKTHATSIGEKEYYIYKSRNLSKRRAAGKQQPAGQV